MKNRAKIEAIRFRYLRGEITLEQAKEEVEPILKIINKNGEKIAKSFGKKFRPFTFGYVFR